MPLKNTLGNKSWLIANEAKLRAVFPETWTHIDNLPMARILWHLKLMGITWNTPYEFGAIMIYLEKIKIYHRDNYLIRRNMDSIIKDLNSDKTA